MKLKQITILKKPVLLVDGLPAGAKFQITEEGILLYEVDGVKDVLHNAPPIKEFVGKLGGITIDQAVELVEKVLVSGWFSYNTNGEYLKPMKSQMLFSSPKKAFDSALKEEGVFLSNPYGLRPTGKGVRIENGVGQLQFEKELKQWQAAESNVFSQDTLIFIQQ